MKNSFLICNVAILLSFVACAEVQTQVKQAIAAKVASSVADKGLNAAATKIDSGNPYLHSVALGLRASEGQIITQATIEQIVTNYGDPKNQHKFQQLGLDIWAALKTAAGKITWNTLEAAAQGLEQGAFSKTPPTPTPSP